MMRLCLSYTKNEKCGLRKYVIVISKLIVRCIENFPIYIFHVKKFDLSWFSSFFTIDIPFHIEIFKFVSKFLDQSHMFKDIYGVVY
jgi:hypothetical protein